MKINPDSPLLPYPGAPFDLLSRNRLYEALQKYELRLVDEYIECQLHINAYDLFGNNAERTLRWWLGSKERIEMETAYFEESFGITFDKVIEVINCLPDHKNMSEYCKNIYRRIMD